MFITCALIVRLQEVLLEEIRLYLVFEFVPMDLKKYMESIGNKRMSVDIVKSLIYQVSFSLYMVKNTLLNVLL